MKKKLIVLTTGGSGGHVFPAQAFAASMKNRGYEMAFITDRRGKENVRGALSEMPVYFVSASAVTGHGVFFKLKALFKLVLGTVQAIFILWRLKPTMVMGFGGYASVPATVAAQFLHIPVALHEQNAILGRANRLLARQTKLIATSFTPTEQIPQGVFTLQTGMPVRPQIIEKKEAAYPNDMQEFRLLIIGGSQGARALSDLVPKALVNLSPELKAKLVVHQQVRAEDMARVEEDYRNSGIKSIVMSPFFKNIPDLLAQAHLVITRSGSSSLAELSTLGKPALLIPLPTSADNHQVANARLWTQSGAGWLMIEKETPAERLTTRLTELMENPSVLVRAAACAKSDECVRAADTLADAVEEIIQRKK